MACPCCCTDPVCGCITDFYTQCTLEIDGVTAYQFADQPDLAAICNCANATLVYDMDTPFTTIPADCGNAYISDTYNVYWELRPPVCEIVQPFGIFTKPRIRYLGNMCNLLFQSKREPGNTSAIGVNNHGGESIGRECQSCSDYVQEFVQASRVLGPPRAFGRVDTAHCNTPSGATSGNAVSTYS